MSRSEVDRFVHHLHSGEAILEDLSEGLVGLDSLVERANAHGYDFTSADVKEYMREKHPEEVGHMNDEELDAMAGGQGSDSAIAVVNVPVSQVALVNPIVVSYSPISTSVSVVTGVGGSDK
jgi:hypothetical protein